MDYIKAKLHHYYHYYKVLIKKFLNKDYFIRDKEMASIYFITLYELYKKSSPKANFFKLLKISPKNDKGQVEIPFNDYEIDESAATNIIKKKHHLFKMSSYEQRKFDFNVYLGASPKYKIKR